jgi:peptidylprolyl isomerase
MRRSLVAVPLAALVLSATAACGDNGGDTTAAASGVIKGLTVTGDFGKEPDVSVDGLDVTKPETGTIIKGDGAEVAKDDSIRFRFYAADGTNGNVVASNYKDPQPSKLSLDTPGPFNQYIVGSHIGDRLAVALPVKDLVGEGQSPPPGLKMKDDLVLVFDVVEQVAPPLDGPKGDAVEPPADAPAVVEKDGDVTGLDFTKAPAKPPKGLQVIPLVQGDGAEVKQGDQLTVDYFGAVWGKSKAFDDSYSRGEPAEFALAKGQLIDGWVQGLEGVKVGSRVMLVIPPKLGYGDTPPSGSDIKKDSVMVFTVDILAKM